MPPLRSIVDVDDLSDAEILDILDQAESMRCGEAPPRRAGLVAGLMFEEPSVRTKFGFAAAAARAGGTSIELPLPYREPTMSGSETLADLILAVSGYVSVIICRFSNVAAIDEVARASLVPVINGGAASVSHPSQALIDLFAMRRHFGHVDGLRIGIMGDIATSRSAKSLMRLMARNDPAEVRLMHPGAGTLDLQEMHVAVPASMGARWRDLGAHRDLQGLDVIYMAGFPAGNELQQKDPERLGERSRLSISREVARDLAEHALILCPMPRIDEIAPDLDGHPAMGMFRQSQDGLHVRRALLGFVTGA